MGKIQWEGGSTYRRNRAIGSKTDKRQKYEAEPSETHVNH